MKKKVIIPTLALLAIFAAIAFTPIPASAQDPTYNSLVTKIAQRFNLEESEVQEVVDQVREEHFAQFESKREDMLSQAVKDGKITEEQKQAFLAKEAEFMEKMKNASEEDHHNLAKEHFDEMKQWAQDNNINLKNFNFKLMRPFGRGHGGTFMYKVQQ